MDRLSIGPDTQAADYPVHYPPIPQKPDQVATEVPEFLAAQLEEWAIQLFTLAQVLKGFSNQV